jgi:hypothetical protein
MMRRWGGFGKTLIFGKIGIEKRGTKGGRCNGAEWLVRGKCGDFGDTEHRCYVDV